MGYPDRNADRPGERPKSTRRFWGCLWAALGVGLVVLILCAGLIATGWTRFVQYGEATDLSDYYAAVRAADLDAEVKDDLLQRIETIRENVRQRPISFFRWLDYDESIRGIVDDAHITPEEAEILDRELKRLEKEFSDE